MAQVKITEYFTSCKRRHLIQPQKRLKTDDGYVNLNYNSLENGKLIISSDAVKIKEIKTTRELIPSRSAPKNKPLSSATKPSSSKGDKTKSIFTVSKTNLSQQKFKTGDHRQCFDFVKPEPVVPKLTAEHVDVQNKLSSDIFSEVKSPCKGELRFSTPKKTPFVSSVVECSPPKRRKQSEDFPSSGKNVMRSEGQVQVSARRSLVMSDSVQRESELKQVMSPALESTTAADGQSMRQGKKKMTPAEIKERLQKCGKLEDVKAMLSSLKKNTDKLKIKVPPSPQKVLHTGKSSKSPEKLHSMFETAKNTQNAPAYERYHNLAAKSGTSLTLPFKYKQLADIFHCVDTVVSLLHNRQEMCTFLKLKHSVQSMMRRAFEKCNLGQIRTVFPLAYFFQQEKCHPILSNNNSKTESYQLTITPHFDYGTNIEKGLTGNPNNGEKKKLQQMNPSCLVERRNIFHGNLIAITKKHHQVFLESLSKPIVIASDDIHRWHPKFAVDDVPEIEQASLPEPPGANYSTARDVLDKVQDTLGQRVQNALKLVAEKKIDLQQSDAATSVGKNKSISTGVLKGISQSLLEKIRAKEASHLAKEMMRKPEDDKKLEMISRLPELIRILRSYLVAEKKSTMSVEQAKMKLSESYHSPLSPEDVEQHINLLSDLLPEWISLIAIRKGLFLKVDKKKEIASLLESLDKERQKLQA